MYNKQLQEIHKPDKKFRSVTTPGKTFYMIEAIAEFVCLQKFGIDIGPKFWYKSANKPKVRKCFMQTKSKLYAMINKNNNIKAIDLLGVALEKYDNKNKKTKKNSATKKKCDHIKPSKEDDIEIDNLIELKKSDKKTIFGDKDG